MEILMNCYIEFESYPQNLPHQDLSRRKLETYRRQLDEHSKRLFCDDGRLSFWDLNQDARDFELIRAKDLESVRQLCLFNSSKECQDDFHRLDCRFIFLYSRNSRSALYTSREMLSLALSYHTVEPWFIDFLVLFGEQDEPHDSRFSSFRHKVYQQPRPALALPRLDRTGQELHLCYNLRAPETTSSKQMPWSVRQTALYHSFDLVSGQVLFIVLKGNDSMSKELRNETQTYEWKASSQASKTLNAYKSALQTHVFICWWSCDNWRTYINYLEQTMNLLTQQAIHVKVQKRPVPHRPVRQQAQPMKRWGKLFGREPKHRTDTPLPRSATNYTSNSSWYPEKDTKDSSVHVQIEEDELCAEEPYEEIEFPDLQRAQLVEEKANEAIYAVKSNIRTVKALRDAYTQLPNLDVETQKLSSWFTSQLEPVLYDLEMHQSSLETLAHLFNERKNLLLGILEFQNMQASKYFAERAQISADTMERMTDEMRELTRKTKDETVSMTAIAGVTMFFLPGTFVSTLMSTDIVQWSQTSTGSFELAAAPGARYMFIALTLPLMFVCFAIWTFVGWRSRRQPAPGLSQHL